MLWKQCASTLRHKLNDLKEKHNVGSILGYLYWRLGREAGTVQRLLSNNHISWGTYSDLLGFHCNSHPNNFVLLNGSNPNGPLLAPLDFDMAFTRKSFVTLNKEGKKDESLFDELILTELNVKRNFLVFSLM